MSNQGVADDYFRNAPDEGNPNLFYDTDPEILHAPESRLGENQKELDPNGPEASRGRIWGMERKTFMIVLVVFVILIIALAAGVGWGVAATTAKSKDGKIESLVSEPTQPKPQGSSVQTDSSGDHTTPVTVVSSIGDHTTLVTVTSSIGDRTTRVTVTSSISSISSSAVPTPIRKNTPLAAVNWDPNNVQVFYKLEDGSIRSRENYGSGWGSPQITNLKPKDDSGFATVGWYYDNMEQIRVYTVSESNALWESGWNSSVKSWYSQDISKGLDPVAAGSYLTAYAGMDPGLWIRVYYQRQDGTIREAAFDNGKGWGKGVEPTQGFPQAKSGSGLAIVRFPDTNEREAKLFYQSTGGKLVSFDYKRGSTSDGSWQNQDSTVDHGSIPDGTQLAAVFSKSSELILRIYFVRDGQLVEIWWAKKSGWQAWNMHAAAALGVAAYSHTTNEDIQVFCQGQTGYLSTAVLVKSWSFTGII